MHSLHIKLLYQFILIYRPCAWSDFRCHNLKFGVWSPCQEVDMYHMYVPSTIYLTHDFVVEWCMIPVNVGYTQYASCKMSMPPPHSAHTQQVPLNYVIFTLEYAATLSYTCIIALHTIHLFSNKTFRAYYTAHDHRDVSFIASCVHMQSAEIVNLTSKMADDARPQRFCRIWNLFPTRISCKLHRFWY
jgi:hypothetical protein